MLNMSQDRWGVAWFENQVWHVGHVTNDANQPRLSATQVRASQQLAAMELLRAATEPALLPQTSDTSSLVGVVPAGIAA